MGQPAAPGGAQQGSVKPHGAGGVNAVEPQEGRRQELRTCSKFQDVIRHRVGIRYVRRFHGEGVLDVSVGRLAMSVH